jgi:hypothetical protein
LSPWNGSHDCQSLFSLYTTDGGALSSKFNNDSIVYSSFGFSVILFTTGDYFFLVGAAIPFFLGGAPNSLGLGISLISSYFASSSSSLLTYTFTFFDFFFSSYFFIFFSSFFFFFFFSVSLSDDESSSFF